MKDMLSDEQKDEILKALDEALENGSWEQSNFLRIIGKNLSKVREDFAKQIGARTQQQLQTDAHFANKMALRSEQQEVFVSLYSADGSNIQSWERIVANVPRQMISRPIYADEEHIKTIIKTKENKQNEAYIAIYINQSAIIPLTPDKALADKLGHPLLSLKDKTLDLENITRFVHVSGVYQLNRGHLIKEI